MPSMPTIQQRPYVETVEPPGRVAAVILVLHGGKVSATEPPTMRSLSMLRMRPFLRRLGAAGKPHGVATLLLHYRLPGWNGAAADPARDTNWALEEITRRYGRVPVVLIGHSMGGRAAIRTVSHPQVVGVCGLAPWLPSDEPVPALAGRTVLMAHGTRDRWVNPRVSYEFAARAKAAHPDVARLEVHGVGHALFRRGRDWHAFARNATLGMLGFEPLWPLLTNALHEEPPGGLRVALEVPRTTAEADR